MEKMNNQWAWSCKNEISIFKNANKFNQFVLHKTILFNLI